MPTRFLATIVARYRHKTLGQSMVEMAMVLPILLLIVVGTIDLGRAYFTTVSLETASKEGAFYGARMPDCDVAKPGCPAAGTVEWRVQQELDGVATPTITVECFAPGGTLKDVAECEDGDDYRVAVESPFGLVTPLVTNILGTDTLTLSASATATVLTDFAPPGSTPVPIPATSATPVPVGTCWVPDFITPKIRKNGVDDFWQSFAKFQTTPTKLGGSGNWQVRGQSLAPGTSAPCATTVITVSDQPIPTPTPSPTPSPTAVPTPTPTPDPAATPTVTPSSSPTPTPLPMCTVPTLTGYAVTQAQARWVNAGFAVQNFSVERPPNNDYAVGTQSRASGSLRACGTTTMRVSR